MAYTTNSYSSLAVEEEGKPFFTDPPSVEEIFSVDLRFYTRAVVVASMSGCVSIIGIIANIVNIIVFVRQGIFKGSVTVSLLGLAVSYLCCATSTLWVSLSYAIALADQHSLTWLSYDVMRIMAVLPRHMFAQITRVVTAYVAFERCVCVVYPFQVRTLFTPKRSIITIAIIFVACGLTFAPYFIINKLQLRMDPITNTSRLVVVQGQNSQVVQRILFMILSIGFNLGSVVIVFFCTMITVFGLKLSKTWRNSLPTAGYPNPQTQQQQQQPGPSTSLPEALDENSRYNISEIESKSQRNTMLRPGAVSTDHTLTVRTLLQ